MKKHFYAFNVAFGYISRYPTYWLWFFLRIVFVAMDLAAPFLLGKLIDLLSSFPFDLRTILLWGGAYVGLLLISPGLEILTANKSLYFANIIAQDFRTETVGLLKKAPIHFFKFKNRGEYVRIIDSAHSSLYRVAEDIIHRYITSIGSVVGIFISAVIFKPFILFVFFISTLLSLINLIIFSRKEKRVEVEFSKKEESFAGGLSEFLTNFRTIFYLNLFDHQEKELSSRIKDANIKRSEVIRVSMRKWFNQEQVQQVGTIAIFCYCVFEVLHGNMTVGTLIIILSFSRNLIGQTNTLVGYSESYIEREAALERFRDELEIPLSKEETTTNNYLDGTFTHLTAASVGLSRDERDNLIDASFSINAGEKIAIVGHTGGGKSTLLDVILKAAPEFQGKMAINGIDYAELTGKDIAKIFSIVPQEVQLFRGTIRENIASSTQTPSDPEIKTLSKICELDVFISRLPNTFEEQLSEGAANISGGERQRIGIARALFQNHPFLILDEATASLDPKTERAVISNIMEAYPSLTLLYVTHKYSLLDRFDKILVIDSGRIIESGTFQDLRQEGCLFKELYEASIISQ